MRPQSGRLVEVGEGGPARLLANAHTCFYAPLMRDRIVMLVLIVLVLAAALVIWLWWSDAWLKYQCREAGGTWNAGPRVCAISAGPGPISSASPRP